MKKLLLLTLLLCTSKAYSETPVQSVIQYNNDWSHFGNSFALTTVTYMAFKNIGKMKKKDAIIFGVLSSFVLSTVYSIGGANAANQGAFPRQIGINALGAGAAAGTFYIFEF